MRPLRVCHIATLTRWGGVETRLIEYLAHRKNPRIQHYVIATSAVDELIQAVEATNTPIFIPPRSFHYDPRALWSMAYWLRQNKVDLVHTYNWTGNVWGILAANLAGVSIRIAKQYGSVMVERPPRQWLEAILSHTCHMTIANSEFLRAVTIQRHHLPTHKVRAMYCGADVGQPNPQARIRAELGLPNDWLIVGSIARLSLPKNPLALLQAARSVLARHENVAFVYVGGGPLESEVRQFIQENHLEERFLLAGWRRDIPELLAAFDIFTLSSAWESLPGTLIEGGLAGCAMIAPAICGIPEMITHNQTGILVTPTKPLYAYQNTTNEPIPREITINGKPSPPLSLHPETYANAISYLLERPDERQRLGQAARSDMQNRFSIQRYVDETETLYLDLAKEYGK